MARKASVYRVPIRSLVHMNYVREEIDTVTGEVRRRPIGLLDDVITGIGRQCDRLNDYDVKPSLLRKLAMIDGLTTERIAQHWYMDKRQAQRYMRKLLVIQDTIARRLPWLEYA